MNAEQEQFVRQLGATQVIDYQREHFEDEVSGVDAVLDLGGAEEAGVAEEPVARTALTEGVITRQSAIGCRRSCNSPVLRG